MGDDDILEPRDFLPRNQLFSRQQLQLLTEVPDDVLAFWIKQGIIFPVPAPVRAHRRFGFEQVHISVVLNAMRSLGANISVLRKFGEALQLGVDVRRRADLPRPELLVATRIASAVHRYRKGERWEITGAEYWEAPRPIHKFDRQVSEALYERAQREPRDETDLIASIKAVERNEGDVERAAEFALKLTPQETRGLDWWLDLEMPDILSGGENFNWVWLAWLDEAGEPRIHDGEDAAPSLTRHMPVAAFYISISRLIRPLWPERAILAQEDKERRQTEWQVKRLAELDETDPREAARLRRVYGLTA